MRSYFSEEQAGIAAAELNANPVIEGETYQTLLCWEDRTDFCILRLYGPLKKSNGLFRNSKEILLARDGLLKQ